jgi:hypothetical protein
MKWYQQLPNAQQDDPNEEYSQWNPQHDHGDVWRFRTVCGNRWNYVKRLVQLMLWYGKTVFSPVLVHGITCLACTKQVLSHSVISLVHGKNSCWVFQSHVFCSRR